MNIRKGFTLIELLVVIAIIGVLSTLAVVSFQGAREKGRDAVRLSDIKSVQTALELYYTDKTYYPFSAALLAAQVLGEGNYKCLGGTPTNGFLASACIDPVYMAKVPADPSASSGTDYKYTSNATGSAYGIEFVPETTGNSLIKGSIYCAKPGGVIDTGACSIPN
ncbi:MAG: prepilin-type N-terminal cleavage/methylation domain-containing protein [Patescibacteria group bacterium]